MSAHRLYATWLRMIWKPLPGQRVTRVRNVARMMMALYLGQSVHLSRIASRLPLRAKLTTITGRFRRVWNDRAYRKDPSATALPPF